MVSSYGFSKSLIINESSSIFARFWSQLFSYIFLQNEIGRIKKGGEKPGVIDWKSIKTILITGYHTRKFYRDGTINSNKNVRRRNAQQEVI